MNKKKRQDLVSGYGFISPALLLLAVFVLLPILITFYLSLTEYNGFQSPAFVGFENYNEALHNADVRVALKNTAVFVLLSVPLQVILPLLLAAVLAARFRNRFGEFVRGALFVPVLCSATLVGTIFRYIFAPDAEGFANILLNAFGIAKVNWLGTPTIALLTVVAVNIWKNLGYYMVIFYAGIMDIPNNLYEASEIDGASGVQQFFYVTLPNLKSVLFMVITVCTIWSFQIFDLPYAMTASGPGNSTTTLVYQLYLNAFKSFGFGYASAIAVILFGFVLLVNLLQRLVMKED